MSNNELAIISAGYVIMCGAYLKLKRNKRRKRRWWMTSINRSRINSSNRLEDLNRELSGNFEDFCRMSASDFEYLLNKIGPHIMKKDTQFRKAIPVNERLAVTLRFLATGETFVSLAPLFKFSKQTISTTIDEVCDALIYELQNEIKMPETVQKWLDIETQFNKQWNFPHCVGAITGKHVVLQSVINNGPDNGAFSIVLMGLVDANYSFIFADIGSQGRISDDVFQTCSLYKKINENRLMLPPDKPLPLKEMPVPYLFVADDAFPLSERVLKPYPGTHEVGSYERAFNYQIARARRVAENAFGLMSSVFRVFRKPMMVQPDKATKIVMSCVLLHNFLRKSRTSCEKYSPQGSLDFENEGNFVPGSWRQNSIINMTSFLPLHRQERNSDLAPKKFKNELANYFVTNGAVPWQNSCR